MFYYCKVSSYKNSNKESMLTEQFLRNKERKELLLVNRLMKRATHLQIGLSAIVNDII